MNANKPKRLINFIIDFIIINSITLIFIFVKLDISIYFIFGIIFIIYYFFFEFIWGKTIGKLITKTKVVCLKNNNRAFWILIRTILRLNPLNIYSFLMGKNIGIHDTLSFTRVKNIEKLKKT